MYLEMFIQITYQLIIYILTKSAQKKQTAVKSYCYRMVISCLNVTMHPVLCSGYFKDYLLLNLKLWLNYKQHIFENALKI